MTGKSGAALAGKGLAGAGFDRRALLAGFGAVLAAPAAWAATPGSLGGGQSEWSQGYDSGSRATNVRSDAPILSLATVQATEAAIAQYQQIAAEGGFIAVPRAERLRLGMRSDTVVALRRRLIQTGDLDPPLSASNVFDAYVEAAIKRFQGRHGLGQTGIVAAQTYAALNTPADKRLKQLEINAVRLRSLALGNLGNRYITINIPAAYVETVENGQVATRHAAGVGKIDRQSPIMSAKISEVNFNPFWTVPASVIRKDLIPKMQADPGYLRENRIRIFNQAGQELQPEQVNWRSEEALRYRFRQDQGGEFNSLGFMRINVHSPHGVYMHDTPAKGIFGDDYRFVSSGCVRVQNVRAYVEWLLKDTPGWDREAIENAIRSGQRVDAKFKEPLFTHWVYITAWATPEGIVQFRDDIYNRDGFGPGELTRALQSKEDEVE
ncbi:MAG: L,D-transpeptidase family protein [Methylocystis sp.]|nr:L,D-transpeptidase family protein [Methylocystis sp.]MCA3585306.1 L,D-transpeptidase family protein [Methylocystis sp.]MCA3586534.1 L,D-transpeptidase family protein [Methylocystis sp.]MCA3593205.1 L,D-transpeptidase family protein [Methylocystis sp.]